MKKLLSIILALTMLMSLSVTAFAVAETETITLELSDSYGDGWDTTSVKACLVKNGGGEEVLGAGMTVSQSEATYEFTVPKFAVVRFYWEAEEEYDDECGVTIKRGGGIQFEQVDFHGMAEGDLIFESTYAEFQSTTVTYQVAPAYTVTIPTTVALGETATVTAENVVVPKGKQVEVSLTDANGFTVATPQGATLTYTVTKGEEAVAEGDTVLTVNPKDGKTGSSVLSFVAPERATFAGTYTGTVTFTVAVKDAPVTIINFTLDMGTYAPYLPNLTTNLQAKEGMTWAEWVESDYNVDGYVVGEYFGGNSFIYPAGQDWIVVHNAQIGGFDGAVLPTDEIISGGTYDFLRVLG